MRKNMVLKAFTLVGFIILLACFVAFKTGAFAEYFEAAEAEQLRDHEQYSKSEILATDTPRVGAMDTVKYSPAMLPTSKSLVVIDQKIEFSVKDTLKSDSTLHSPKK